MKTQAEIEGKLDRCYELIVALEERIQKLENKNKPKECDHPEVRRAWVCAKCEKVLGRQRSKPTVRP